MPHIALLLCVNPSATAACTCTCSSESLFKKKCSFSGTPVLNLQDLQVLQCVQLGILANKSVLSIHVHIHYYNNIM